MASTNERPSPPIAPSPGLALESRGDESGDAETGRDHHDLRRELIARRVHGSLALIHTLARRLHRRIGGRVPLDELESSAREGLFAAASSYDPARGVPFDAWAAQHARGRMIDGLRAWSGRSATALAWRGASATPHRECDPSVGAHQGTGLPAPSPRTSSPPCDGPWSEHEIVDESASPEELVASREIHARAKDALDTLPSPERDLLAGLYFDGLTLDEAARSLGLSKSWGSRLHSRALEALREALTESAGVPPDAPPPSRRRPGAGRDARSAPPW